MSASATRLVALALIVAGLAVLGRAAWLANDTFGASDAIPSDAIVLDEAAPEAGASASGPPASGAADASVHVRPPVARLAIPLAEPDEGVDGFVEPSAAGARVPAAADSRREAPSRIVIPTLGVDSPVVGVSLLTEFRDGQVTAQWQVARNAVGFHTSSALVGSIGNTVMSGHNNRYGSVFRNLAKVGLGDTVLVYVGDRPRAYSVVNKVVARVDGVSEGVVANALRWLEPTPDDRLTLVSCWPPTGNSHRVFVVAMPTFADE